MIEADCIGSAAHVTMLSKMPVEPALITADERDAVVAELVEIIGMAKRGEFEITLADQDVHLAVERTLTNKLGDLGKKIHTCRSRNDQVAVDLRLFAKMQLFELLEEAEGLVSALIAFGKAHEEIPMVGRTHMQPECRVLSIGATAHAEFD